MKELKLKKSLLNEPVSTIYFGGGTPSILTLDELAGLINQIYKNYSVDVDYEFTMELNPDDVTAKYVKEIKGLGVNRLSIGIQSFDDEILKFLNRGHSAKSATDSIKCTKTAGFDNISVDLIYGIPGQRYDSFHSDLLKIEQLGVNHLSAYHLGVEENTYFGKIKKLERFNEISESQSDEFFELLMNWSDSSGFEQYEISSFALQDKISRHNSNYWAFVPYLGFGPSAHSYVDSCRIYNVNSLKTYIQEIDSGTIPQHVETILRTEFINENILLKLRTKWGLNLLEFKYMVSKLEYISFMRRVKIFENTDHLRIHNNVLSLTRKGIFISDYIIRELLFDS